MASLLPIAASMPGPRSRFARLAQSGPLTEMSKGNLAERGKRFSRRESLPTRRCQNRGLDFPRPAPIQSRQGASKAIDRAWEKIFSARIFTHADLNNRVSLPVYLLADANDRPGSYLLGRGSRNAGINRAL